MKQQVRACGLWRGMITILKGSGHEKCVHGELHAIQSLSLPPASHPQRLGRPGVNGRSALVGVAIGDANCACAPADRLPVLEDFPGITPVPLLGLLKARA